MRPLLGLPQAARPCGCTAPRHAACAARPRPRLPCWRQPALTPALNFGTRFDHPCNPRCRTTQPAPHTRSRLHTHLVLINRGRRRGAHACMRPTPAHTPTHTLLNGTPGWEPAIACSGITVVLVTPPPPAACLLAHPLPVWSSTPCSFNPPPQHTHATHWLGACHRLFWSLQTCQLPPAPAACLDATGGEGARACTCLSHPPHTHTSWGPGLGACHPHVLKPSCYFCLLPLGFLAAAGRWLSALFCCCGAPAAHTTCGIRMIDLQQCHAHTRPLMRASSAT